MSPTMYAREHGLPLVSELADVPWTFDRAHFARGWAHEQAMVALIAGDSSAYSYWLQVWALAVGVGAGLAAVQPSPVYYCAVDGCPGYPWSPSGSAPHPCRGAR